jgi:hypothetical protein
MRWKVVTLVGATDQEVDDKKEEDDEEEEDY